MERKELTVKDLERAIEKLKEIEAPEPHKVYIAHDDFLQDAIDYFSDRPDIVVMTRDGRKFRKGKEEESVTQLSIPKINSSLR